VNIAAPALEVDDGWGYSSGQRRWDWDEWAEKDLQRRMFPARNQDGSRRDAGTNAGVQHFARSMLADQRTRNAFLSVAPELEGVRPGFDIERDERFGVVLLFRLAPPYWEQEHIRYSGYSSERPSLKNPEETVSSSDEKLYGSVFAVVFF